MVSEEVWRYAPETKPRVYESPVDTASARLAEPPCVPHLSSSHLLAVRRHLGRVALLVLLGLALERRLVAGRQLAPHVARGLADLRNVLARKAVVLDDLRAVLAEPEEERALPALRLVRVLLLLVLLRLAHNRRPVVVRQLGLVALLVRRRLLLERRLLRLRQLAPHVARGLADLRQVALGEAVVLDDLLAVLAQPDEVRTQRALRRHRIRHRLRLLLRALRDGLLRRSLGLRGLLRSRLLRGRTHRFRTTG